HSFVASGVNCQELYIDYRLMTAKRWEFLAKVLKWGRANQHVMADNHWVGGDPFKIQPYGWAAWSPEKSIVTLRNPSDKVKTFSFNPRKVLELPTNVKGKFVFKKLWSEETITCDADETITITLEPLKTVTWESI
ncbi:MAG: enterotoxin, partial [Lentisphaeria bacterium]|nr:enterotoxin [Lentisphaeria bacterium]